MTDDNRHEDGGASQPAPADAHPEPDAGDGPSPSGEASGEAATPDDASSALDVAGDAVSRVDEAAGETPDSGVATAEAEAALAAARAAVGQVQESVQQAAGGSGGGPEPFTPEEFGRADAAGPSGTDIDLLGDVELDVKIELGRTRLLVEDVLNLGSGAVVELEKLAGDPVDVFVNDRHVAKGEVLVLNDQFSIRINEIFDPMAAQSPTGRPPQGTDSGDTESGG